MYEPGAGTPPPTPHSDPAATGDATPTPNSPVPTPDTDTGTAALAADLLDPQREPLRATKAQKDDLVSDEPSAMTSADDSTAASADEGARTPTTVAPRRPAHVQAVLDLARQAADRAAHRARDHDLPDTG